MKFLRPLEKNLDELFARNTPELPSNAKKILVAYLPYISLILGALALLAAWDLYDTARTVNSLVVGFTENFSVAYGGPATVNHLSVMVWVSICVLIVEALLYIAAFQGTKGRRKSGWDLLLYSLALNVAYGVAVLFTDYGGIGRLVSTVIGSAIGLYLLFQIRSSYVGAPSSRTAKTRKPGRSARRKRA